MELSTSLNVLWDPPRIAQPDAVTRVAAAGFRRLDMNFTDWLFDGSPFVGAEWETWVRDIRRAADAAGARFTQAHGPIYDKFAGTPRTAWLHEMSHRSLIAAGMLGTPWVVFEPETMAGTWDAAHVAAIVQRNADYFGALLPTAERAGVGIAIENVADYFGVRRGLGRLYGSTPLELLALMAALDHPRIGICWDTGHAHIQQLNQRQAIVAVGPHLRALHIQDNDAKSDQHLLPYYGSIRWEEVMAGLRESGYGGDFTYEAHNSIRILPDPLRDAALRYAVALGEYLLAM